jgi:ABC-type antimicrobial peptide transport system permease subunit
MMIGDMGRTALSNLGRRKVRTVLTSIGVIVGILTIVTMVSLGIGVRLEINKQFQAIGLERVFVSPREGEQNFFTQFSRPSRAKPITDADVARWRALPDVKQIEVDVDLPFGVASGLKINDRIQAVGIEGGSSSEIQTPFSQAPTALAGTLDLPEESGKIILTASALRVLDISTDRAAELIGQPVTVVLQAPRGEEQNYTFTVVGVSSDADVDQDPVVRVPLQDRVAMKSWWFNKPDLLQTDGYDSVTIRATDVNAANALVQQIRGEGFRVQSLQLILDLADQVFTVINVMLSSVGGLALLVASLGIVNTMIMSIYERTREIGTLKAIGASRGDIRMMFMFEAGMIGLMGGIIGIVSGWGLGKILNRVILWYVEREQLPVRGNFFVVTPWLALYALLFATLIGILAGLYPANRAARLDPLMALRHE